MSTSIYRQPAEDLPAPIARVAGLMSTFHPKWSLCGGWAIDAWIGHQTRDHGDLDIVIFEDDQRAIFKQLAGWHMIADIEDSSQPNFERIDPWDGRRLDLPSHIHARPEDGFELEILFNERTRRDWVLRREPLISIPLSRCARGSPWGLPTVVPEVLLFFKATAYAGTTNYMRPRDRQDFLALKPHLSKEQRDWLREAISVADAEHPWLAELS